MQNRSWRHDVRGTLVRHVFVPPSVHKKLYVCEQSRSQYVSFSVSSDSVKGGEVFKINFLLGLKGKKGISTSPGGNYQGRGRLLSTWRGVIFFHRSSQLGAYNLNMKKWLKRILLVPANPRKCLITYREEKVGFAPCNREKRQWFPEASEFPTVRPIGFFRS